MSCRIDAHRLHAALALRARPFNAFAFAVGVTPGHLREVLLGNRTPSARLIEAMRLHLGNHWSFAIGETDELPPFIATSASTHDA